MTEPLAFHDLPASSFPFTIEILDNATREVAWSEEVTGPGAVRIPGLDETGESPKAVRLSFADGQVVELNPPAFDSREPS